MKKRVFYHLSHRIFSSLNLSITAPLPFGTPICIAVNKTQVMQLFQNLLSNAIKFHGTEPPRIEIRGERRIHEWLFSVKDNGIGTGEHKEKIFELFQRAPVEKHYKGRGIGLAICKKIVERHGGRIWVESQRGKGSTFYFTISSE